MSRETVATVGKTFMQRVCLFPFQKKSRSYAHIIMKPILACVPFLAAALFLLPAVAQDAKTYTIKMERPDVKGTKFDVKIASKQKMAQQVIVGGQVVQEGEELIDGLLEGEVETLAVDDKGKNSKLSVKVKKFTKLEDEGQKVLVPAGKEIIGELKDGKEVFTVEGEAVDPQAAKLLTEMMPLGSKSRKEVDENEVFGLEKPRAVGSEWDLSVAKIIDSMPADMPFEIVEDGSSGKMKLEKIGDYHGIKSYFLTGTIKLKVKNFQGMPPDLKVNKSNLEMSISGAVPVDESVPELAPSLKMTMEMAGSMKTPDGAVATIKVNVHNQQDAVTIPIK
jgi:hypothetical protein